MKRPNIRLTDEELSRVLSQQAVGKLRHSYDTSEGRPDECGCIAETAEAFFTDGAEWNSQATERMLHISDAVDPGYDQDLKSYPYPDTPEALLAYLHARGVA